jgi:hypothetical protein
VVGSANWAVIGLEVEGQVDTHSSWVRSPNVSGLIGQVATQSFENESPNRLVTGMVALE